MWEVVGEGAADCDVDYGAEGDAAPGAGGVLVDDVGDAAVVFNAVGEAASEAELAEDVAAFGLECFPREACEGL